MPQARRSTRQFRKHIATAYGMCKPRGSFCRAVGGINVLRKARKKPL